MYVIALFEEIPSLYLDGWKFSSGSFILMICFDFQSENAVRVRRIGGSLSLSENELESESEYGKS